MNALSSTSHLTLTYNNLPAVIAVFLAQMMHLAADTFGSGAQAFEIEFVTITGGATADTNGYGAVGNDYRIGKHEISTGMINAYNALGAGPAITLSNRTADKPATLITWNEAARFVNWMNLSNGYFPAYKFESEGISANISLWTAEDVGYDAANPFRNRNARYFLPSENEWYRAAFYDPVNLRYWNYATGSNSLPVKVAGGTTAGTAVWDQNGPADVTNAGGLSPFGTMAQAGNVFECTESELVMPNDNPGATRAWRGGSYADNLSSALTKSHRIGVPLTTTTAGSGFRVASTINPPVSIVLASENLAKNGNLVTTDIISNCGNVDVYRSLDLDGWIGPIASDLAPGTAMGIDLDAPVGRAFYMVVPANTPGP